MKFKVSAVLPTPANVYFVERDSAAFRSLVAQVRFLDPWLVNRAAKSTSLGGDLLQNLAQGSPKLARPS